MIEEDDPELKKLKADIAETLKGSSDLMIKLAASQTAVQLYEAFKVSEDTKLSPEKKLLSAKKKRADAKVLWDKTPKHLQDKLRPVIGPLRKQVNEAIKKLEKEV